MSSSTNGTSMPRWSRCLTRWPMAVPIQIGGLLPTSQWRRTDRPAWAGSLVRGSRALPYVLTTTTRPTRVDRPILVEAKVEGDLRGNAMWSLTSLGGKIHVRFDFRVFADRPFLRYLTPILRPLFRWNHRKAIANAVRNLEPYARRQAGLPRPDSSVARRPDRSAPEQSPIPSQRGRRRENWHRVTHATSLAGSADWGFPVAG